MSCEAQINGLKEALAVPENKSTSSLSASTEDEKHRSAVPATAIVGYSSYDDDVNSVMNKICEVLVCINKQNPNIACGVHVAG